jgi:predicted O-methyltransferase YrrM
MRKKNLKIIYKRVFINLIKPHKILPKILKKINFYIAKKNYNINYFIAEQNKIFKKLGLNRTEGIKKIQKIKNGLNFENRESPMSSEHEVLFSSLSLDNNIKIKKILEIGTFDGMNSLLLSKIFPNAKIDTIDLAYKDDDFKNFYNRKNKINKFIKYRNNNLKNTNSIRFMEMNSIHLINNKKKYDLIWVDGAHGYPIVCADIINCYHLINNKGAVICDDIFMNLSTSKSDRMYESIASYETLSLLKKEKLIDINFIYKRIDASSNCLINERKFIAIFKKNYLKSTSN